MGLFGQGWRSNYFVPWQITLEAGKNSLGAGTVVFAYFLRITSCDDYKFRAGFARELFSPLENNWLLLELLESYDDLIFGASVYNS